MQNFPDFMSSFLISFRAWRNLQCVVCADEVIHRIFERREQILRWSSSMPLFIDVKFLSSYENPLTSWYFMIPGRPTDDGDMSWWARRRHHHLSSSPLSIDSSSLCLNTSRKIWSLPSQMQDFPPIFNLSLPMSFPPSYPCLESQSCLQWITTLFLSRCLVVFPPFDNERDVLVLLAPSVVVISVLHDSLDVCNELRETELTHLTIEGEMGDTSILSLCINLYHTDIVPLCTEYVCPLLLMVRGT